MGAKGNNAGIGHPKPIIDIGLKELFYLQDKKNGFWLYKKDERSDPFGTMFDTLSAVRTLDKKTRFPVSWEKFPLPTESTESNMDVWDTIMLYKHFQNYQSKDIGYQKCKSSIIDIITPRMNQLYEECEINTPGDFVGLALWWEYNQSLDRSRLDEWLSVNPTLNPKNMGLTKVVAHKVALHNYLNRKRNRQWKVDLKKIHTDLIEHFNPVLRHNHRPEDSYNNELKAYVCSNIYTLGENRSSVDAYMWLMDHFDLYKENPFSLAYIIKKMRDAAVEKNIIVTMSMRDYSEYQTAQIFTESKCMEKMLVDPDFNVPVSVAVIPTRKPRSIKKLLESISPPFKDTNYSRVGETYVIDGFYFKISDTDVSIIINNAFLVEREAYLKNNLPTIDGLKLSPIDYKVLSKLYTEKFFVEYSTILRTNKYDATTRNTLKNANLITVERRYPGGKETRGPPSYCAKLTQNGINTVNRLEGRFLSLIDFAVFRKGKIIPLVNRILRTVNST